MNERAVVDPRWGVGVPGNSCYQGAQANVQADPRNETHAEVICARIQSGNAALSNLEMRLRMTLSRIGHQDPARATPDNTAPKPSAGTFHDIGNALDETAQLCERLTQLVNTLETYV